jgi:sterol desaturase/sphingolipid hydroxylase (fatty acid hydroxylase superfamily)
VVLLPVFTLLLVASLSRAATRRDTLRRTGRDWVIDLGGLLIQGAVIPLVLVGAVAAALAVAAPAWRGAVTLPPAAAFFACFVGVDAIYYLNHRALHAVAWPLHQVHHEAVAMDVLSTSRNTAWTSLLIVYLWADAAALFLLADPTPWLWASTTSAALDLWRHSDLDPPASVARWLRPWLVLPGDHARHHGASAPAANFGANFNLWDRLGGTWLPPGAREPLGRPSGLSLAAALLWPFP